MKSYQRKHPPHPPLPACKNIQIHIFLYKQQKTAKTNKKTNKKNNTTRTSQDPPPKICPKTTKIPPSFSSPFSIPPVSQQNALCVRRPRRARTNKKELRNGKTTYFLPLSFERRHISPPPPHTHSSFAPPTLNRSHAVALNSLPPHHPRVETRSPLRPPVLLSLPVPFNRKEHQNGGFTTHQCRHPPPISHVAALTVASHKIGRHPPVSVVPPRPSPFHSLLSHLFC